MKFFGLLFLMALQVKAVNLTCQMKGQDFVSIYGLSERQETHGALLRFKNGRLQNLPVTVRTLEAGGHLGLGGAGEIYERQIQASSQTGITFAIRISQDIGKRCKESNCKQKGLYSYANQSAPLICRSINGDVSTGASRAFIEEDSCMALCGRPCRHSPVFCGQW